MTNKERVKLRLKQLGDGRQSCYLDYQKDGKRIREALSLYLLPETSNKVVADNKRTMKEAQAIRTRRQAELTAYETGIEIEHPKSRRTLSEAIDDYHRLLSERGVSAVSNIITLRKAVAGYRGDAVMLSDVDADYCNGFVDYLLDGFRTKWGRPLAMNGAECVVYHFSSCLNLAVDSGHIRHNPMSGIKVSERIKRTKSDNITFLTAGELKLLMATQCPVVSRPQVKQSFLLACFTGLSLKDVKTLMWKDIKTADGVTTLPMASRKTRVPLSDVARRWLPEVKDKRLNVFKGLPTDTRINDILKSWSEKAGIAKPLSFRIARDTFIYLLLTTGTDIVTLAEMLNFKGVHSEARLLNYAKMAGVVTTDINSLSL